jgi:hypothetical protein
MNIPASTASIAIIVPKPLKYTAGTRTTNPEMTSQTPSSNIPTFFVKSMEIFLSFYVRCEYDLDAYYSALAF